MTLYTTDYLEYYLTLVSWIVHNGIWAVLVASGFVAVPFVTIVMQEWLRVRADGGSAGDKGVLSAARIESRVFIAIIVIMFAGVPIIDVDFNTLRFDVSRSSQCQVATPEPAQTGWSQSFTTLNNQSAQVPVWWYFVHSISRAVTGAAVAAIPCGTDLRQIRMDIDATRINDPVLAQEVVDFSRDCYGPARARLFTNRPDGMSEEDMYDVSWIGSRLFVDTPGYYDAHRSQTPRRNWPYNPGRDVSLAEVPNGGGYPRCNEWWSDASEGLRARLLAQVSPDLLTRVGRWAGFVSRERADDSVIRAIAAPRAQKLNQGAAYTDYGGQIGMSLPNIATRVASDIGLTVGSLGFFPAMDVLRQALPMVLALLKLGLVVCIPLILIVGAYDLKVVVTMSVVQFALFFIDFFFQFARWIDSTILDALYGWGFGWNRPHQNLDPLIGLNNAFGDMLLNFVMATMFVVLPGLWVTALTWAGIRAGGVIHGLAAGTHGAVLAGAKGTDVMIKGVK